MSRERPLRGRCHCGRNTYIIEAPPNATETAEVFFNHGPSHRHTIHSSPLHAYLRVPLSWYHSTTYAYFTDETHSSIRRSYTSPLEQQNHSIRQFCGFCGTNLSFWSENPRGEEEWICLSLGSLVGEDLRDLGSLGLLEGLRVSGEGVEGGLQRGMETQREDMKVMHGEKEEGIEEEMDHDHGDLPWFQSLIRGSELELARRRRGQGQSGDGRVRVEWEIVEILPDDGLGDEGQVTSKRKLGDVSGGDVVME